MPVAKHRVASPRAVRLVEVHHDAVPVLGLLEAPERGCPQRNRGRVLEHQGKDVRTMFLESKRSGNR
jgi:hypothetical protein